MENKLERIVKIAAVVLLAGVVCWLIGLYCGDVLTALAGQGTALAVGLPVAITDVAAAEAQGLNMQDVSQEITKMNPDRYPLDTIMRNYAKKVRRAESQECKYYQQSAKPMQDTLDQSAHGSGSSAASPCSSYVCDETGIASIFVQVKTPKIWRTKDTLLMRSLVLNCDATGKLVK